MPIYQEILSWSQTRPDFIKDALRRIISNSSITQDDIRELISLLKKEQGDTSVNLNAVPIDSIHIPATVDTGTIYPKLIGVRNPINVCSLYDQAHLEFASNGLTVVYGNNGSGKSSYARVLKKLCWSRNPNVELKKNVFAPSVNQQGVELTFETNGTNTNFQWVENAATHPSLNAIYVFDNECGDVYVSRENPTEYKPVGIDVLENLIPVLNTISQGLSFEIASYTAQKPILDQSLSTTAVGQWYVRLESKARTEIDSYIQFSQADLNKKQELFTLINSQNPQQNIQSLSSLRARLENYIQQFERIERAFNDQAISEVTNLRNTYATTIQAYDIATNELGHLNTIAGFGTNPWRTLWDAAKNFANSNGMSDGVNFPSNESLEKCVLCQQELDESAQQRLLGFNQFILNDVSTRLNNIQREIQQRIAQYNGLVVPPVENFAELTQLIPDFQNRYNDFLNSINGLRSAVLNYLQNGGELNIVVNPISIVISGLIPNINGQIDQNNQLLNNRNSFIIEYNELLAKEFLFNNKASILQYYDQYKIKSWLTTCQAQLSTTGVSRKIGELMENQAVSLQHQEFNTHLQFFNLDLASKVLLAKTRTSQGNTFQKCGLSGVNDAIDSILSEGEQKIIALSNFLAECTIDNKRNSIVFDDPVTSLDMDYRDLISAKLVDLCQTRQIIVLTHDLSFVRLLIDTHKGILNTDCHVVGIDKYNGMSGIVTDEIPYLAKNVQERINSIRGILTEHDALQLTDSHGRETKLDSARKRFRMLLERSVEEILSNKTYERFSKNIHLKKGNLSGYIVTERTDVDFLLGLFGKYSVTEHDGGISTLPQLPNKTTIEQDITAYSTWKDSFKTKLRTFVDTYN